MILDDACDYVDRRDFNKGDEFIQRSLDFYIGPWSHLLGMLCFSNKDYVKTALNDISISFLKIAMALPTDALKHLSIPIDREALEKRNLEVMRATHKRLTGRDIHIDQETLQKHREFIRKYFEAIEKYREAMRPHISKFI